MREFIAVALIGLVPSCVVGHGIEGYRDAKLEEQKVYLSPYLFEDLQVQELVDRINLL